MIKYAHVIDQYEVSQHSLQDGVRSGNLEVFWASWYICVNLRGSVEIL